MSVQGYVAPGFESVKQLYEHKMATLAERNSQLCIYVGSECVVDLWYCGVEGSGFNADALVNVFSSGKSLEAILLAMLSDQGLLDFNTPIAKYWPEFAANGKDEITVADLMRHEAGLAAFDTTLNRTDLHVSALLENRVGAVIEQQTPAYPSDERRREYHAITRGWVANEVFRRVEPGGRTMGQFLRDEVAGPLDVDLFIGVPDDALDRIDPVVPLGAGYQFVQSLIPKRLGRKIELNFFQIARRLYTALKGMRSRGRKNAPAPIAGMDIGTLFNSREFTQGETPSAGAKCTARGLAKLAAVMANGGSLDGHQLLSPQAHADMHAAPIVRDMGFVNTAFSQGGVALFESADDRNTPSDRALNNGREGFIGWMGLGGSIFQWHPEKKIGFAYVPTSLNIIDLVNERGKAYQAEVVNCINRLT